jgi:hypothetical protein
MGSRPFSILKTFLWRTDVLCTILVIETLAVGVWWVGDTFGFW